MHSVSSPLSFLDFVWCIVTRRFKYVNHSETAHWKVLPCTEPAGQANDFELIPTVRMERQHSIGAPTCHHVPRFVIISEKLRPEVGKSLKMIKVFLEKRPLKGKFSRKVSERFIASQKHVLCANFVKIGWPEIGKVLCCLPDKKKTKILQGHPLSLLRGSRPKSVRASSKLYTRSSPNFIQTVPFWWSYSRTREHRWNAPQSISNTRRSFFAE